MATRLRGGSLRMKDFADVSFQIGITGNVTESDISKIETVLLAATLVDTKAVNVGTIMRWENDQFANQVESIDKTSAVQTRKMILSFEDAGALVIKGQFPLDPSDMVLLQTAMIGRTLDGEKITKAVLGI